MFERSLERDHVRICAAVEIEIRHRADAGGLTHLTAQHRVVEQRLCCGDESFRVSRRDQ
jgi:hypothetical protein